MTGKDSCYVPLVECEVVESGSEAGIVPDRTGVESSEWTRSLEEGGVSDDTEMPTTGRSSSPSAWRNARSLCIEVKLQAIDPSKSSWKGMWDVLMWFVILAVSLVVPYEVAFLFREYPVWFFLLDRVFDVCTVADMVVQFLTACPDPKRSGYYDKNLRNIAWRYVTGFFLFDLMSLVPGFMVIHESLLRGHGVVLVATPDRRLDRLLRLARLVRMSHLLEITDKLMLEWESVGGASHAKLTLVNFLLFILLCSHWMACIWGGVATLVEEDAETNWINVLRAAKGGPASLYEDGIGIYSLSLYWSIMTLTSIGYGDITPQTEIEYWVCSFCMLVSGGTWAFIIGQVCGVVTNLIPHDVHFKQSMDDLNWLMEDRNVDPGVRKQLRRFLRESQNLRRLKEQKVIIDQMSPMLQGEVTAQLMRTLCTKVPYLTSLEKDVITRMSRRLKPLLFAPAEAVHVDRTLCCVRRGAGMRGGKVLVGGDVWGSDMILQNEFLRDLTPVRCMSYFEVLSLKINDLIAAVHPFPAERAKLRWAETKLAVIRATKLISKANRVLKHNTGLEIKDLTDIQRLDLYADVLAGNFSGKLPAPSFAGPMSRRRSAAVLRYYRTSGGSRAFEAGGSKTGEALCENADGDNLDTMKALLTELADEVRTIKEHVVGGAGVARVWADSESISP